MPNPFATDAMAAGYVRFRPPVHSRVIELLAAVLRPPRKYRRALDVGCGAGLSTRPLGRLAGQCIGIDPVEAMLRAGGAGEIALLAGCAEALPFRSHSIDLMTAAGSLNYVDFDAFFSEAGRVLAPGGVLAVYDFSAGRSFRDGSGLDDWFEGFRRRYPPPPGEARKLSPEILASMDCGFRLERHEYFEFGLALTPGFYLEYMLTETNVAFAIRGGTPAAEIRSWIAATLEPVFEARPREVLFRGYLACMRPAGS